MIKLKPFPFCGRYSGGERMKEIVLQDIVKIESATPVTITMEDGSTFVANMFDFISEYEAEMMKQGETKEE